MDGSVFFYAGGALVLAALVLSAIGIRNHESFPPNRGVMALAIAAFAVLVAGAISTAVVNAREEQDHRRHDLAEERAQAAEEVTAEAPAPNGAQPPPPGPAQEDTGAPPGGGVVTSLDVASPEDGSLVFEPSGLEAPAGSITINYANPSPVPHSIAIEAEGKVIDESDPITSSDTSASGELSPGSYIYFCTVPGHREAGMEGTLTVQ